MYSYMDWDGLKPQKWRDKGRKKFEQQALEIITPRESDVFLSQVQTKVQKPQIQNQLETIKTPIVKQSLNNQESYRLEKFYSEPNFRKQFEPLDRQIYYEKKHLRQEKDSHLEDLDYGIKTFEKANKETYQGYILEDEMQRKVRINDHRNGIGTHFLGDKAYHIPEYSSNFYKHPDGAIPGSNIQYPNLNYFNMLFILSQLLIFYQRLVINLKISQKQNKTEQDFLQIIEYMSCFQYFEKIKAKYNADFMKQLCKHLYLKTFGPNQNISVNRTTYIILSGRVLVTQELDSTKPKTFMDTSDMQQNSQVSEMTFGQSFNEFGLQDVQKSTAITLRQTDLVCLDFKFIIELNSNIKSSENNEKIVFLKQLTYIQQFSDNEIKYFAYKLEVIKPQKNETIYQEGDEQCDWAYFVFKGEFSLTKRDDNQTEHQLTRLVEGEIFGEESFLNYERRFFNIKCLCDSAMLFRISNIELEKKVWQRESRNILFLLIGEKWIFRLKRFVEMSKQSIDTQELKSHLTYLEEISSCKLNFQFQETEFNSKTINNQLKSTKGSRQQKSKIFPISLIVQNSQQFNQFFQHQTCKAQHSYKNLSFDKTHTNTSTKLADNYPKNSEQQPKRRVLQKIINPNIKSTKISSHFNFTLTTKDQPEIQLDNFVKPQNVLNDEIINWGGNSSRRNQELKEQFYNAIKSYASHVKYQNLNLMEASSNYSKQLNNEYELLMKKQQENIGNFFELEPRSKTDNQLRKEYFLKQLKKMQKRLQVLQMIAKGYITCKYNQYVNEEGEIVDIIEKVSKDDAYEIKDGKKQLKFNFVTSINYKPIEKPKFKDFDQQIVEQEEQIRVISDIVSGKIDPEQVPYVNEEYAKQIQMRKKASEVIQTPTLVKSFSSKLRISSATYKKDLSKNLFSNAIKIRKMT